MVLVEEGKGKFIKSKVMEILSFIFLCVTGALCYCFLFKYLNLLYVLIRPEEF